MGYLTNIVNKNIHSELNIKIIKYIIASICIFCTGLLLKKLGIVSVFSCPNEAPNNKFHNTSVGTLPQREKGGFKNISLA